VEQLLNGAQVEMPPVRATFSQALRVAPDKAVQPTLGME